jgi:hypothetical protein
VDYRRSGAARHVISETKPLSDTPVLAGLVLGHLETYDTTGLVGGVDLHA